MNLNYHLDKHVTQSKRLDAHTPMAWSTARDESLAIGGKMQVLEFTMFVE